MKSSIRIFFIAFCLISVSLWAADKPSAGKKTEAVQSAQEKGSAEPSESIAPDFESPEFAIEERPATPSYEGAFLKMILALLLLLFVIFFGVWLVRRLSASRLGMFKEPKHIRIIDRRPLSAKTALYLIEVGEKRVLVAESQLEVRGIATIDLTSISPEE